MIQIDKIHQPHDAFIKKQFKTIGTAKAFFKSNLPEKLANALNFSTLTLTDGHYIDDKLRQFATDLLYKIHFNNGQPGYLYILFEHASTPQAMMQLRMLEYMVKHWQQETAKKGLERLKPIVPMVMSQQKWNYKLEFIDLIDLDDEHKKLLAPWIPDFSYLLLDLSTLGLEDLKGNLIVKITLALLKSSKDGEKMLAAFAWLAPLFAELMQQKNAVKVMETILRYAMEVTEDITLEKFHQVAIKYVDKPTGDRLMTIVEQISAKNQKQIGAKYQKEIEAITLEKLNLARDKDILAQKYEKLAKENAKAEEETQRLRKQLQALQRNTH